MLKPNMTQNTENVVRKIRHSPFLNYYKMDQSLMRKKPEWQILQCMHFKVAYIKKLKQSIMQYKNYSSNTQSKNDYKLHRGLVKQGCHGTCPRGSKIKCQDVALTQCPAPTSVPIFTDGMTASLSQKLLFLHSTGLCS